MDVGNRAQNPYGAGSEQVKQIARGHLLLAAANALQPGVFGVSTWDLVGCLPVPLEGVHCPGDELIDDEGVEPGRHQCEPPGRRREITFVEHGVCLWVRRGEPGA